MKKNKIRTFNIYMSHGWGIMKIEVYPNRFVWMCQTHEFIERSKEYDFDLFTDVICEFPCFCFVSEEEARLFTAIKSNAHPIDYQMEFFKRSAQYWFSTVAAFLYDTRTIRQTAML